MKKLKLFFLLLILDQASKYFTQGIHKDFKIFALNSTPNTGTFFGLAQGNNLFFIFLTLILLSLILYFYKKEAPLQYPLLFIITGATGNLLDRIFRGYVPDFLDFKIWPIFNLADSFITLGIIYCVYKTFKEK